MSNYFFDGLFSHHRMNSDIFAEQATWKMISYADFVRLASKMANILIWNGLRSNDRVTVQAPKSIEVLALYVATIQAGSVFIPLNSAYTVNENSFLTQDANPHLFVYDPKAYDPVYVLRRVLFCCDCAPPITNDFKFWASSNKSSKSLGRIHGLHFGSVEMTDGVWKRMFLNPDCQQPLSLITYILRRALILEGIKVEQSWAVV